MKPTAMNVQSPEEVSTEIWLLARAEWRRRNEALKKIGTTARATGLTVEEIATEIRNNPSVLIPLPSWTPTTSTKGCTSSDTRNTILPRSSLSRSGAAL